MQQTKPNNTEQPKPASTADTLCTQRGLRLTRVRRLVLEYLLNAQMPVKAYDIQDALRLTTPKTLPPASIYRALDYLQQEGLVHKVGTLNAYVACTDTCPETCYVRHPPVFMLVCPRCRKSKEISDPKLYQTIVATMQRQGFQLQGDTVELTGTCPGCAQQQEQNCSL